MRGGRSVLRLREFRLLFYGHAVSLFGDGITRVALPFAVLEVSRSASAVGLVLAARMLPLVACLLAGGVVADRTSRRAVMVAADLVRCGSQGAMAVALVTGTADVWSLAALAGLTGAASGFFNPAATGVTPAVVPAAELARANGLRATAQAAGEVGGPAIAGILVALVGAGWALAVDAATFAASAAFLSRLRLPAGAARVATGFVADLRAGWRLFRSLRWVWTYVLYASVRNLLWGAWSALGPVVADRDLGGAAAWGTVLAAVGVGGLAGGVTAMRADPGRPLVVCVVLGLLFALPLPLLAAGVPVAVLAAGAFLSGVALLFANSLWESTLQRHVPHEALSRVSAYDWFGSLVFAPVGLAIWGPVATAIGIDAALWLAFAGLAAITLVLLAVPEVRALRSRAAA